MDKVNISREKLQELMDNETWIKPEDAVEMAFATGIVEDEGGDNASQSAREAILQALDRTGAEPAPLPVPQPEPQKEPEQNGTNNILKLFERSK